MHDGMACKLSGTRYVASKRKNLISVVLESKGCKVSIQDDMLKALKDALLLIKGERRNTLYFL